MELMIWIGIGIVTVVGFIVLVPLLVIGSWFVIVTVILGLVDGAVWLVDGWWKTVRGGKRRPGVSVARLSDSQIQPAGSLSPTLQPAFERK